MFRELYIIIFFNGVIIHIHVEYYGTRCPLGVILECS